MSDDKMTYDATTRSIHVSVEPMFLDDQSEPEDGHFVWAYRVEIENLGSDPVQLRSRYWHITDAKGRVQEVRGAGVVGKQPRLDPGESFVYTSGAPLKTPSGFMMGHYVMETGGGETFEVEIPPFSLDSPYETAEIH